MGPMVLYVPSSRYPDINQGQSNLIFIGFLPIFIYVCFYEIVHVNFFLFSLLIKKIRNGYALIEVKGQRIGINQVAMHHNTIARGNPTRT